MGWQSGDAGTDASPLECRGDFVHGLNTRDTGEPEPMADLVRESVAPRRVLPARVFLAWPAALSTLPGCAADPPEPPPFAAVADDRQLMLSVLEPAAETYWDAVGVIMDEEGTRQIEPHGDEEWEAVVNAAYQLAESGNLLLLEERAQGREHWTRMSRSMIEVGRRAVEAAVRRDPRAVFDMGAEIYFVCTGCHSVYATGTLRPSDIPDSVIAVREDQGRRHP